MKKILALSLATLGGAAFAFDLPEAFLDLGGGYVDALVNLDVYVGHAGPYSAFASGAFAQIDDYTAAPAVMAGQPRIRLNNIRFVGGVAAAGGILDFFFLGPVGDDTVYQSFSATLPSGGDFLWTISGLSGLPGRPLASGRLQIQTRTGTTGRWFFTSAAPTLGSNSVAIGTGSTLTPQRNQAFSINGQPVPEPGTMIAVGAGLAALAARRRRK